MLRTSRGARPGSALVMAVASTIAFALQIFGVLRYVERAPDDKAGVGVFTLAALAFAVGAVANFIRWVKLRRRE
jgi:hypothetical protein